MTIEITHTAAEGTLVHGTARGDGTNTILKAAGFRWFRTLGVWGIAGSRDRQPNRYKIERAAESLRAAGHTVTVDVDDTHRPTAEAEADRAHRQAQRADALAAKADRKAAAASAAWESEQRAVDYKRRNAALIDSFGVGADLGGVGFFAEFRKSDLAEGDVRQIEDLGSAAFLFAVDPVVEVLAGRIRDAFFGFGEEVVAGSVNDRATRANRGAGGWFPNSEQVAAEFAFYDLRIDGGPFEFRNVKGAGELAAAASDALVTVPGNRAKIALG